MTSKSMSMNDKLMVSKKLKVKNDTLQHCCSKDFGNL